MVIRKYFHLIPLFVVCGLLNGCDGCQNNIADYAVALARLPRIGKLSMQAVHDGNGLSVAAIIKNYGYDDSTKPFTIHMTVETTLPGKVPPLYVAQDHTITIPGSPAIAGTHGTPGAGAVVTTSPIIGGFPYDPNALYHIFYVIDENGTAFNGTNSDVNTFVLNTKLP